MIGSHLPRFLQQHHAHAAICFRLDEQLGLLHGMSWADFVQLDALDATGGSLSTAQLAQTLSVPRTRILLQLIPLEKIGLAVRIADADGSRRVVIRPNGRRLLNEARETAVPLCEHLQGALQGEHGIGKTSRQSPIPRTASCNTVRRC